MITMALTSQRARGFFLSMVSDLSLLWWNNYYIIHLLPVRMWNLLYSPKYRLHTYKSYYRLENMIPDMFAWVYLFEDNYNPTTATTIDSPPRQEFPKTSCHWTIAVAHNVEILINNEQIMSIFHLYIVTFFKRYIFIGLSVQWVDVLGGARCQCYMCVICVYEYAWVCHIQCNPNIPWSLAGTVLDCVELVC